MVTAQRPAAHLTRTSSRQSAIRTSALHAAGGDGGRLMRHVSPWTRSPAAPSRAGRGDPRRGAKRARVSWRDDSQGRSVQRTNPGPPQAHSHGGRALVLWVGAAAWVKRRCDACDARALRQLKRPAPRVVHTRCADGRGCRMWQTQVPASYPCGAAKIRLQFPTTLSRSLHNGGSRV